MSSVIETKLVLTGQDDGASRSIQAITKALKDAGEGAKVSKEFEKLTKSLLETEKAQKAVTAAMKAEGGLKDANARLPRGQGGERIRSGPGREGRRQRGPRGRARVSWRRG
jgi:hypothetical protein